MMNLECRPAAVGQLCAWLRVCEEGGFCDVLAGFRCQPKKPVGSPCLRDDCQDGLRCALDAERGGLSCVPQSDEGGPCAGGRDCRDGLFCYQDSCQRGPIGQPCDRHDSLQACPLGYVCDQDNRCAPPPAAGEHCDDEPCAAGLVCAFSQCQEPTGAGTSCTWSQSTCAADLHCTLDGTCVARGELGDACEDFPDGACRVGLTCLYDAALEQATCVAGAPIGGDCDEDTQCASGVCGDQLGCVASDQCVMPGVMPGVTPGEMP